MMERSENGYIHLDINGILAYLKNRKPLLMIEDVYVDPGKNAYSERKLNEDEWFFECHFPGKPMMPGVLQLESIFNTAAMPIKLLEGYKDKTTNIAAVDYVKFRKQILPGELIRINADILKFRRGVAKIRGTIESANILCCETEFSLVVLDDVIQVEK